MEIKDVLHYYIGQECYSGNKAASKNIPYKLRSIGSLYCEISSEAEERTLRVPISELKPILRSLDYLNTLEGNSLRDQYRGLMRYHTGDYYETAASFHYLLSKGFDLFGLLESGQAIDKKKLKNYEHRRKSTGFPRIGTVSTFAE